MLRILTVGLALLAGCVAQTEPDACEAGKVEACPCDDGKDPATQACKADGSGWGACQCSMLDPAQSDPGVSCKTEVKPGDVLPRDTCPAGLRQFLVCDYAIVQSGICYKDPIITMYCCKSD